MIYGAHELARWPASVQMADGSYAPARPIWNTWGRWRHAWWVLSGRCDALWWPEDGNPYGGVSVTMAGRRTQIVNDALLRLGSARWGCDGYGARLSRAVPCPDRTCLHRTLTARLSLHDEAMDLIARHEGRA